jgi:hypothetical protein
MMSPEVEPVRKSVVVRTGVERAFALFTTRFDAIKPREHNLLSVPIAETVFEPRVGGHIYDVGMDGSLCKWARVLANDPPSRVVEVRFIAESDDRPRVELEHRHLDRHGPAWRAVADGVDGDAGWPLYLSRYLEIATAEALR